MEALRAANRGMARAVCQGAKTAKRYAALGAGMEVDAQGYGREPTAMVRGVLSCLFVCLFVPTGYSLYERQYSFRRQPEVAQRDKGVTTLTCFLPRGRRAQARSVGEGASPCQANLGVFHGRLLRRGVRAKGAGPSGRRPRFSVNILFVCLFE